MGPSPRPSSKGCKARPTTIADGTVYLNELDLDVTERVKTLTGGKQHPVTEKPTTIRSFPLARPWSGLKPSATTPR